MAKVELKQPIVQAIVEDLTDAQSAVIVNYCGLTVAQDTELRKQLREAGVIYKVCKNTMMKRAFEGTDFAQLDEYLEGPNAIAISKEDATAPARIICNFAKKAEALEVKAGVLKAQYMTQLVFRNFLRFRQEKYCCPNYLEAYSHLLQTLPVFLIRSQNRVMLRQKLKQKHRQQSNLYRNPIRVWEQ